MSGRDAYEMAGDPQERAALEDLSRRLERAGDSELEPLPPDLRARTLAAVERAAHEHAPATAEPRAPRRGRPRRRRSRWLAPGALAGGLVIAAAAVVAAVLIASGGPKGELEAETTLAGTGGTASVEVGEIGVGRTVDLDSRSLRILPKGEYYEVWFVAPDDSRRRPKRISAGTFHPNAEGRTDVRLNAAVNPALYPMMEVTAERGDGNPRASGRVVLRRRLPLKG